MFSNGPPNVFSKCEVLGSIMPWHVLFPAGLPVLWPRKLKQRADAPKIQEYPELTMPVRTLLDVPQLRNLDGTPSNALQHKADAESPYEETTT